MKEIITFAIKVAIAAVITIGVFYYISPLENCVSRVDENWSYIVGPDGIIDRRYDIEANIKMEELKVCRKDHSW